ncbi:MAG: sigma-70 family RNA polymerase sigma factor [Myxococcales bacterium]
MMATGYAMGKLDFRAHMARLFAAKTSQPASVGASELELALVERLRNAEPAAIDELYRAHHGVLRAFAQRLVGDTALAEDLVHDVFVEVPKLVRKFRGQSSLRSFLVGVAANLASRHVRSASRKRAALMRFAAEREPVPSLDGEHAARERMARLHEALDALSLEQRTAFVLCELEERSALEVAQLLDVPEATVRTRCFHARKKLRKSLARLTREEAR